MREHNSGICVAPAGSGKTIIAAALVLDRCHLLGCMTPGANVKVSWIAHTKEQVQQACDALQALGVPDVASCMVSCSPPRSG
jgi:superfamily II DNA or RNA helicase